LPSSKGLRRRKIGNKYSALKKDLSRGVVSRSENRENGGEINSAARKRTYWRKGRKEKRTYRLRPKQIPAEEEKKRRKKK